MKVLAVLLCLALAAFQAGCGPAAPGGSRTVASSMSVPVSYSSSQMLWLTAGEKLSAQVKVSGGEGVEGGVVITVEGPSGIILDLGKVRGARSFTLTAKDTGNHLLHFKNLSAAVQKKVDYSLTVGK